MNRIMRGCAVSIVAALGAGCGGGGGAMDSGFGGPGEPALVSWNGSVNGTTIKDADNDSLAFTTDGVMYRNQVTYPGVKVRRSDASITWNGAVIGVVSLVDAASGNGKVAATYCVGGAPLNFTFLSDHVEYNCVTPQSGRTDTGVQGGSSTPQGSSRIFVRWTGNTLEYAIKDADEDYYVVDSVSRQVLFVGTRDEGPRHLQNPSAYANTQVDSKANVIIDNVAVGYVSLAPSGAGTPIAVFRCADGRALSLWGNPAAPGLAQYRCNGNTGGGSGPVTGGGGSTYSFTPFNGSANGICIIDNSGDCFAVDSRTRILSFLGPVQSVSINDTASIPSRTYGNARGVYDGNTLVGLSIDGQRVADVYSVQLSTPGKRGPAFICEQRYYAEIYENPQRPGDALIRCTTNLASF